MPILEGDIKILKSAVMADTTDGGGQMTGSPVIDGQSNNLFPDTSEIDRALGRVNMRKVFGVAHTTTTDTLLGAHAIITDAPDDPLVHCALLKSTEWADTRTTAKDTIERYLVKGPRLSSRLLETHYAGSLTARLYAQSGGTDFPAAGDAIVLRNTDETEQYVRITRMASSVNQTFTVFEGGNAVSVTVTINTYELGQPLARDFVGAPVARAIENEASTYASVYTTTPSAGASFYGVKTVGASAVVGDISVTTSDGIFHPLVPAATIETPIIDQAPGLGRNAVASTSQGAYTLPAASGTIGPNAVLKTPTAIEPKTLSIAHSSTTFTDDGGVIYQGATAVGSVDYGSGVISFSASSPGYPADSTAITYKPASKTTAAAMSSELAITSANQGLAFTDVFTPAPSPGSLALSYMAQGRWYTLNDNGSGKLAGADAGYGVGTISYASGSVSMTLGALPDIGSVLIAEWGDASSAAKIASGLPGRVFTELALPAGTGASGITVTWSNGGNNYTATSDPAGVLSGDATGALAADGVLNFEPDFFPTGTVTVASSTQPTPSTAYTGSGLSLTLTNTPVAPGSVSLAFGLAGMPANAYALPLTLYCRDSNGLLVWYINGSAKAVIGSINYATGALTLNANVTFQWLTSSNQTGGGSGFAAFTYLKWASASVTATITGAYTIGYWHGTAQASTLGLTPSVWRMNIAGIVSNNVLTSDMMFTLGNDIYYAQAGVVSKGWGVHDGQPAAGSIGAVDNTGSVSVSSLPSNGVNAVTWHNAAQGIAGGLATHGVFRTASNPLKTGVFQLLNGSNVAQGDAGGTLTGGGFTGSVDYLRGIARWTNAAGVRALDLRYNAVFLQYLPLDGTLLGLETARLPLDGRVPIFRAGGIVVVHNTQATALPDPLVQGTAYSLGRTRIAAVKVKTAAGATVDATLYTTDLDAGTIAFPPASVLTGLLQPFTVDHRIEDVMLCSVADISGKLTFTRALSHDFPSGSSYASSALVAGDVFARAHNYIEQETWNGVWSDELIGAAPTANFNEVLNPIEVTNAGAITERWAIIFTNTTTFRVVGQSVGEIAAGNIAAPCAPLNPATGAPYFTIPDAGWGAGWSTGNVYRFNTAACGTPFWVVRTVLQGPATLLDDKFTLAFRGDVDRP